MLILTTKDIIYKHDMHPIRGNTILEVTKLNEEEYRVTRGSYERVTIKASNCVLYGQESAVYPESYQELLQRREEVKQLMVERDGYLRQMEWLDINWTKASEAYTLNRVKQMELENRLKSDIQALKEQLKLPWNQSENVVLPKEVAEAIEGIRHSKDGITEYGILRIFTESGFYKNARDALNKMHIVNSYSVLMQALVNGYTIEEPAITAIDEVADLIQKWTNDPTFEDEVQECRNLAALIINYVEGIKK